jgi:hypothetical protein
MSDIDNPNLHKLAEDHLLTWLRLKHNEGMAAYKKERAFEQMADAIRYIDGRQYTSKNKSISTTSSNRLRKIALETVATMTDVRPIWNYETYVEMFAPQGDTLNKLARAWWRNNHVDRRLASILLYACAGGSAFGLVTWNREAYQGEGDLELVPFDPRDVIPIDPVYSDNIQDWGGIILRQRFPSEKVRQMFPAKANYIIGKELSWSPIYPDKGGKPEAIVSPLWESLDMKKNMNEAAGMDVMRAYFKDDSKNLTDKPITMGEGDWSYEVPPMGGTTPDGKPVTSEMARLYPRGRLVVFTPECILRDIPNPHWHGQFPVVKFTLDPLPWTLLGASLIGDLIPLQDALNQALRGTEDGLKQWVQRGVAADKRSMPKSALDALDTRMGGLKLHYNPAAGEPFKVIDGPDPQVFGLYEKIIELLKMELEDTSGMRGVAQLSQLGQMPSADTMERYMEALSPILRLRSRSMEVALSQLAHMLKVGFFQWYTAPRRIELLGKDGLTREDFDYDPNSMVPAGEGDRASRAMRHQKLFSFQVAPNSWLNVSHTTQKMLMLQLLRGNLMDPWTIWDQFDVPDAGTKPAETVPERIKIAKELGLMEGPTPELVQAQLKLQMGQIQMQMLQIQQMLQQLQMGGPPPIAGGGAPGPPGPPSGGPPKASSGPVGRPPSGQIAPHFELRDGGTRPVVSESA